MKRITESIPFHLALIAAGAFAIIASLVTNTLWLAVVGALIIWAAW